VGAYYNFIAFISAFLLVKLAKTLGPKLVHSCCLIAAGLGLFAIGYIQHEVGIFVAVTGLGLCWASMMGNPYVILAGSIPPERTGIYMGIFNMFIVIPMLLQNVTMPLYYEAWLGGNPVNAIKLAGVMLVLAALATFLIKNRNAQKLY
jgi:maltose/moltooligosaccharide transporter